MHINRVISIGFCLDLRWHRVSSSLLKTEARVKRADKQPACLLSLHPAPWDDQHHHSSHRAQVENGYYLTSRRSKVPSQVLLSSFGSASSASQVHQNQNCYPLRKSVSLFGHLYRGGAGSCSTQWSAHTGETTDSRSGQISTHLRDHTGPCAP